MPVGVSTREAIIQAWTTDFFKIKVTIRIFCVKGSLYFVWLLLLITTRRIQYSSPIVYIITSLEPI